MEQRKKILEEAMACVCEDRNARYGEPEDNFRVIAELWMAYLKARCVGSECEICIEADDVANLMILFKVGRAATALDGPRDIYIDIAGYAACAGGMIE